MQGFAQTRLLGTNYKQSNALCFPLKQAQRLARKLPVIAYLQDKVILPDIINYNCRIISITSKKWIHENKIINTIDF